MVELTAQRNGKRSPSSAMEYTTLTTVVSVHKPHENTVKMRPAVTRYWGTVKPENKYKFGGILHVVLYYRHQIIG